MYSDNSFLVCPPDHFAVSYEINAWMQLSTQPDDIKAREQWRKYISALTADADQVKQLDPVTGLPDLVFTANHALVRDNKAFLAGMTYPERQAELPVYRSWFEDQGFETAYSAEYFFEGEGDAFIRGNTLILGTGFRTDARVADPVCEFLGLEQAVICEMINPYFYHLDTCFAPLTDSLAVIYPPAFTASSLAALSSRFELIEVSEQEAKNFACNLVPLHPADSAKQVLLATGCPQLCSLLENHGYKTQSFALDQFFKAGGSAKCLCLRLNN